MDPRKQRVEPLLVKAIKVVFSDQKSQDKEEELGKLFEMIEIDYNGITKPELLITTAPERSFPYSVFADHSEKSSAFKSSAIRDKSNERGGSRGRDKSEDKKVSFEKTVKGGEGYPRDDCQSQSPSSISSQYHLPPINPKYKYTIVLDLDETLVHFKEVEKGKEQFLVRPHAREFIKNFGKIFELVVFTAAKKEVRQCDIVCQLDS